MTSHDLVVVGASWGGLAALGLVLSGLPRDFGAAVAIAQHRGVEPGDAVLADALGRKSALPVREVHDKDPIVPGWVHVAPSDYHLLVEQGGTFALSTDPREQYSRPSIDVLFESAADAYGASVIGIVLTGANEDGAAGLARIAERGGVAIVQDPETAEAREMPEAAIAAAPATVLPLERIGPFVTELAGVEATA